MELIMAIKNDDIKFTDIVRLKFTEDIDKDLKLDIVDEYLNELLFGYFETFLAKYDKYDINTGKGIRAKYHEYCVHVISNNIYSIFDNEPIQTYVRRLVKDPYYDRQFDLTLLHAREKINGKFSIKMVH